MNLFQRFFAVMAVLALLPLGVASLQMIRVHSLAQQQLTDIVFMELPAVGAKAVAGKEIANVESVKAVSPVYAPVSGEVIAVNESLTDAPEKVNQSPFDEGWMIKIKMDNPSEADALLTAAAYKELIAAESH